MDYLGITIGMKKWYKGFLIIIQQKPINITVE